MASDEDETNDALNDKEEIKVYYKCCAKKLCKLVTCVNCYACYHTSCAKIATNIKPIGGNRVVCCDRKQNEPIHKTRELEEKNKYLEEIVQEVRGRNSALELANKLLLDKIKSLEDNLMSNKIKQCETKTKPSYSAVTNNSPTNIQAAQPQPALGQKTKNKSSNVKHHSDIVSPTTASYKGLEYNEINVLESSKPRYQKTNSTTKSPKGNEPKLQQFSSNSVKTAIMEAQTALKMKNIQHLSGQNDDWKVQKRRQSRRFVVGGNNDEAIEIKAIPKYVSLHVTRLRPDTKPEELKKMLLDEFPEVQCENHLSKFPELYTSMKVTIKQEHFKKAWRRSVWPEGALVSKFFAPKRIPTAGRVDPQSK